MDHRDFKRPPLPAHWYRPTIVGFVSYTLFSLIWLPLFGCATMAVLRSDMPLWARLPLAVPCIVLAGHGFHILGFYAHDGVHLSLVRNKYWSMLIGCFGGGIALFPLLGYGVTHWNHHRFTNQVSDPDTTVYPRHTTFWARFFMGRATANRGYIRNTVRIAMNAPLEQGCRIPFTPWWTRFFAIFTLLCMGFWLAVYVAIAATYPAVFVACVLMPFLSAAPITGLRIYLEHNGTGAGIFRDTRSYVSPLWTALMFGNNYHLEHHLYPTVPAYHLARVHRLLRSQRIYDRTGAHIVRGFFAPLRYVLSAYQYPSALIPDLEADPFVPETRAAAVEA